MIDKGEILELAREFGLAANVVEKDYVLGWLLAGIFNSPLLNADWVFKGGTCLKKCYFETYRFSEDLDFTLKSTEHLDEQFLVATFGEIAEWIYDHSGIEIPVEAVRFEIFTNRMAIHRRRVELPTADHFSRAATCRVSSWTVLPTSD